MSFGLKNARATYIRAMITIFHDMIHKEIEVYVDDIIINYKRSSDHIAYLKKFFDRLRKYNLKFNRAKCAFGVPSGKLLGFIVSRRGIEMLRKDAAIDWSEECQKALDKIKEYLSKLPILIPPEPGRPLLLYFSVLDRAFGCILGQHDETRRNEQAIYYLSKKFTLYEARRRYHRGIDGWRMFFNGAANFKGVGIEAVLVSETGQHYSVSTKLRFPCTNIMEEYKACILGLRLAIDMNVQELLVIGDSDLLVHQVLGEWATKNTKIFPYFVLCTRADQEVHKDRIPRIQNEFADALATLSSMIQHPDNNFIDPIQIRIHKQPSYCVHVEEEIDGNPWFHNIKKYQEKREHPETVIHT
ncbi:uncharacterized protein [Nicotiana sylvestris]|uniref:uncharacterized protein n=1 Tax=Nicotiana sylvestris TaxID=4096 RepID=UPI00388C4EE0